MRRTKIVATVGPATWEPKAIRALLEAGADVVRVNLAHGTKEEHAAAVRNAREQAKELGKVVGVLADLPGPKMRTGPVTGGEVELHPGQTFTLTNEDIEGDATRVSTTLEDAGALCQIDEEIYLADGEIVLTVKDIKEGDVITEVRRGGRLRSRKGMHIPRAERKVEAFTHEDRTALDEALALKVDFVGLSFVRDEHDIERVKEALPRKGRKPLVIAKIETATAIEHLIEIVSAADAVMVARGDLGIQMPLQMVPLLQKQIIAVCNDAGKPVITATQMLDSMTHSPLPTRAEAADVANAVIDGTHALMLSEETAIGDYPVETVTKMSEIAEASELVEGELLIEPLQAHMSDDVVSWAVAHAAVLAAEDLDVAAILCPTRSGSTPFRVAAFRPSMPIIGLSDKPETLGALTLVWGVTPLHVEQPQEGQSVDQDVERTWRSAKQAGIVKQGDRVAIVAGSPGRRAGRTDYMRIAKVH
jgi:pyruvate kinase